jgi:hypothetical protein
MTGDLVADRWSDQRRWFELGGLRKVPRTLEFEQISLDCKQVKNRSIQANFTGTSSLLNQNPTVESFAG